MSIAAGSQRRVLILVTEADRAVELSRRFSETGIDVRATTAYADFVHTMQVWRPTHVAVGVETGDDGTNGVGDGVGADVDIVVVPSDEVEEIVRRIVRSAEREARATLAGTTLDDLDHALDLGRLSVAYHPKVDTRDGTVFAVEALARWHRPGAASVPPEDFIRLAEISGRIERLSDAIFQRSLTWFGRHLGATDIELCLNVSALSLADEGLPARLERMCRSAGVDPSRLLLEVTETSVTDPSAAHGVLESLRVRGMRVALDDFGAGHASLLQLSRHPFTDLKIDRGLVATAASSTGSRAIVSAAIRLGSDLGLRVIAEGVEDEATHACLASLGCPLMQGNFLTPPLEPAELLRWLDARGAPHA